VSAMRVLLAHRGVFWIALFWQCAWQGVPLVTGLIVQQLIDQLGKDFVPRGLWLAVALAGLEVLYALVLRNWTMAQVDLIYGIWERFQINAFRVALENRIQPVAVLVDRIGDTYSISMFPAELYRSFARVIFGLVALVLLWRINPWITAATFVPMAAFVFGVSTLRKRLVDLENENASLEADSSATLEELIRNAEVVQRHGGQEKAVTHFLEVRSRVQAAGIRMAQSNGIIDGVMDNFPSLATALVLLFSAGELLAGRLTAGQFALFTLYLDWLMFVPLRLGELLTTRSSALAAERRLLETVGPGSISHERIDTTRAPEEPSSSLPQPLHCLIENLPNHRAALEFIVRAGSITVIQGAVGTGKTVLLEALLGRGPAQARIQSGSQVTNSLEHFAGFAAATPQFVDASLLENIALHRAGTWDHVANLAVLDRDSSLHAEVLLTNNTGLSGGQRARLAVARAAFDRPGVLILDDPSSALDDETADELWQRLRASGQTVIIASNHPGARAMADQVIDLP
jgi:ATP-binding cassette, subfamily B, bacterial